TGILRWAFPLPLRKAAAVSLAMNVTSGFFGVLVLPFLGLAWESALALATYSWANLALTWLIAVITNVGIESLVVLACGVPLDVRRIGWIAAANVFTVGLIFAIYVLN